MLVVFVPDICSLKPGNAEQLGHKATVAMAMSIKFTHYLPCGWTAEQPTNTMIQEQPHNLQAELLRTFLSSTAPGACESCELTVLVYYKETSNHHYIILHHALIVMPCGELLKAAEALSNLQLASTGSVVRGIINQ